LKNAVFFDVNPQFILHRKHVTKLQIPAG
jgi:hypothetical protein